MQVNLIAVNQLMINHLICTLCHFVVVISLIALMLVVKFSLLGAINMNDAIKRLKWGKLILVYALT